MKVVTPRSWRSFFIKLAFTAFFWVMLIWQIIDPSALGRIGTDPTTGRRWRPTLYERGFGYTCLGILVCVSTWLTIVSLVQQRRRARNRRRRARDATTAARL